MTIIGKPYKLFLFGSFLLLILHAFVSGQDSQGNHVSSSPFRYVIIENSVTGADKPELASRHVEVLLDSRAFSEKNLRLLFALVSKRFTEPRLLYVDVHTSFEQAPTPEERDRGGISGTENRKSRNYLWAVYVRTAEDEYFRYSPISDKRDIKTVELSSREK